MRIRSLLLSSSLLVAGVVSGTGVQAQSALPRGGDLIVRMVAAMSRANTYHQVTTLVEVSGGARTAETMTADVSLKPRFFHGAAEMSQKAGTSLTPRHSRAEEFILRKQVAMAENGQAWQCSTVAATRASIHGNALAPSTLSGPLAASLGTARTMKVLKVGGVRAWDVRVIMSSILAGAPLTVTADYEISQSSSLLLRDSVSERITGEATRFTETGTDVYSHYGTYVSVSLPPACG